MSPFQRLACPQDRVTLPVHQSLDLQGHFDLATPVEALPGAALVGLELGELRLPEAKNVRLNAAQARNIADLEIQAIWDYGRVDHALSARV